MPEGHSIHRIAKQFDRNFVGQKVTASSPQGRFESGAKQLSGHEIVEARAVGKNMFLGFDHDLWLRVHLGIYGAWDFAGEILADATIESSNGRIGQTQQRGTVVGAHEDSLGSIGAPRLTRLRMSEQETAEVETEPFPPEPIGQVRLRLLAERAVADLRGPTICEIRDAQGVQEVVDSLGPDPLVDEGPEAENRFALKVKSKQTPIGVLLMDQSVVSGIGNIYRAELLFRAKLNPHIPGKQLSESAIRELWLDWSRLLRLGVETGQIMTMDGLSKTDYRKALANRADRHWVYHRTGLPCRVCGTNIVMEMAAGRKLYWCPKCQA
ncbi:MAG: Fpg/Nei family DNA glycosylase [Microbacteriaceae bacterium]|nr:Fpg/Nei family DNA glycosylase [Microbacteriaceae bacterium]